MTTTLTDHHVYTDAYASPRAGFLVTYDNGDTEAFPDLITAFKMCTYSTLRGYVYLKGLVSITDAATGIAVALNDLLEERNNLNRDHMEWSF